MANKKKYTVFEWERITRGDNSDYMWRLKLLVMPWFRIYLHIFVASDDDCLHDHPWNFWSLILSGGYWEVTTTGKKWYGPGRLLYRPASWKHQVVIDKKAVTLCVTTGKLRNWGFWTKAGEWIHHRVYDNKVHCAE